MQVKTTTRRAGPLVTVPSVTGVRVGGARWRLKQAGLAIGRVSYRNDEDHIDKYVLSQRPKAGARVPKGTTVDLVVNNTD